MEAENNAVFIKNVSDWLGGASFAELNQRLPDVADVLLLILTSSLMKNGKN